MNQPFILISNETTRDPKKRSSRGDNVSNKSKDDNDLGAITALDPINSKACWPQDPLNKRKVARSARMKKSAATITMHHYNFISNTIDILNRHPKMKGSFITMDKTQYT